MDIKLYYANVFVSDAVQAIPFYRDTLGLEMQFSDEAFGYTSFQVGSTAFAVVQVGPEQGDMVGRHTGIGWMVEDLDAAYAELKDSVTFVSPPEKQPWGGYMAVLADPDGNLFYLDEIMPHHG